MEKIEVKTCMHRGQKAVIFLFSNNYEAVKILKTGGAKYTKTYRGWWLPIAADTMKKVSDRLQNLAHLVFPTDWDYDLTEEFKGAFRKERIQTMQKFHDLMRSRRYAESTIKTYTDAVRLFLNFCSDKPLSAIGHDDLTRFNVEYILARKLSSSAQNQVVNGVKKFFLVVENRRMDIDLIERPKKAFQLPHVLSKEEIRLILSAPINLKHRAMLSLIYACGLRRSELLNLKPQHIDSKRNVLIIEQGKGRKDRIAPLSDKIIDLLRVYYKAYRPQKWLFEGQQGGNQYSARSLQLVLKKSIKSAGINKPVTLHWLRHSYATHLLENGTDLRYIQEILGHKSSKTTEIYTHVSTQNIQKIKSPFDDL